MLTRGMATKTLGFRADDGMHERAEDIAEQYEDISKSDAAKVIYALGADGHPELTHQVEGALLNASMVAVVAASFIGGFTVFLDYPLLQETVYSFAIAFFFLVVFALSQALGGAE